MTIRSLTSILVVATTLSLTAQSRPTPPTAAPQTPRTTPPLVVLVVVDQFRADYVQRYGGLWTKGLRRLIDRGAYFPLAAYPYSGTLTCAGHSTIGTGAFPRTHGMIANTWYDRETKKSMACTQDAAATSVGYGGLTGTEHHSPKWLATNTFADELRNQLSVTPKIASLSLKARSAIGMAGHAGDLVVWFEDAGLWASSTAYTKTPQPAFSAYAEKNAIAKQYGRVWDRLLPAASYQFTDEGVGEQKPDDGSVLFPHPQTRPGGKPDQLFYTNWERTPFVDEALTDMAITFSDGFGKGKGTDMLAVSYSALDYVGHRFGPKSHEVQDVLLRLDVQLGKLFDVLDQRVGAGQYVVALTADHGVAPIPEQVSAEGLDAGRFTGAAISAKIVAAFTPFATDAADPVLSNNGTDVYFSPAALAVIRSNPAARKAVEDAALSAPGVARAYWGDELAQGASGDDAIKRAEILSYMADRSGDLMLVPKQYWMATSGGTTHGSPNIYDQRVPIMLMGFGIRPGRYLTTTSPADVAPTFAYLTGITLPRAEGRPLTEAVVR